MPPVSFPFLNYRALCSRINMLYMVLLKRKHIVHVINTEVIPQPRMFLPSSVFIWVKNVFFAFFNLVVFCGSPFFVKFFKRYFFMIEKPLYLSVLRSEVDDLKSSLTSAESQLHVLKKEKNETNIEAIRKFAALESKVASYFKSKFKAYY